MMSKLYRVKFTLIPKSDGETIGLGGEKLHGFIFEILANKFPKEAEKLHNAPVKPFAISPIFGSITRKEGKTLWKRGAKIYFYIGCAGEDILTLFIKSILNLPKHKEFVPNTLEIVETKTNQELLQIEEKNATLQFTSPFLIKKGNLHVNLPLPSVILPALARKWEALTDIKIKLPENLDKIVKVKKFSLRSEAVHFSNYILIGCRGVVQYEYPVPQPFSALFNFAKFLGVGYKTTMGMGWVK